MTSGGRRPAVLYPDVPHSTWQQIPGALNPDGLFDLPLGGFLACDDAGNRVLFDLGGGPAPDLLGNGELPTFYAPPHYPRPPERSACTTTDPATRSQLGFPGCRASRR